MSSDLFRTGESDEHQTACSIESCPMEFDQACLQMKSFIAEFNHLLDDTTFSIIDTISMIEKSVSTNK